MIQTKKLYQTMLCLAICCSLQTCAPDPVNPSSVCGTRIRTSSHPKAAVYQAILNQYVRRGLPGISASVRDEQGEWTGAAGKADIARNIPMESCHITKIASITKMCVGTLAFLLAEEGKLSMDDPITRWLPGHITSQLPNAGQITLLRLLSHQTGLHDFVFDREFYLSVHNNPTRVWTQPELLSFVYGKPAAFRPGIRASYSNTNTVLVSMVIEAATGRSHAQLLREKILEPLGMEDTYYQGHDVLPQSRVAQGYFDLYNNNTITNVSNYNTGAGNGFGGLLSTVYDLQLFINALFVEKTLVTDQSLDQMMQFTSEFPHVLLGAGVIKEFMAFSTDLYGIGHSGGDFGYTSYLYWLPEQKATMAILINYGSNGDSSIRPLLWQFQRELAARIANQ